MGRKPRDISRNVMLTKTEFDAQSFVDGVFNDEYILVVGSSVILNRFKEEFIESKGDINQHIINEINKDCRAKQLDFVDYKSFTDVFRGTALDEIDPIYTLLTDGYECGLDDISDELQDLLRTKLFKFVLTTTIDGYLETLMRDIWKDELRVVNISDNKSMKDFQDALERSRVNKYTQPTLFYVFGKVIPGRPKPRGFVETDVDAIKYIEKWIIDIDSKYIVPFLKSKRMLSLGCKFDDWYFRFFWYIITRGFDDNDREGIKGADGSIVTRDNLAALFDLENPSDQNLKAYLQRRGVCMHDDVWSFMKDIHSLLTSLDIDSPFRNMILGKRREGEIFISYKSKDKLTASKLFCKLARENKLNVWFDNVDLIVGGNYFNEIEDVIKHKTKIFIPILSPSVCEDLAQKGETIDEFYSMEWRWAAERESIIVLPVAIGGYDLRGEQNKVFEKIIKRHASGIDMTEEANDYLVNEATGFAKLLKSIYQHLGIEEL